MKQKTYAIIDIETTGGRAAKNKITEIAIVLHDGEKIVDRWETLLDPECPIPYGITQLTGITNEMVTDAPKFYEVARKIVEMTEGAIFVAHNVRFDYGFIREEFNRLGYCYTRRQLCTVRLSRKAFPGLRSYSLENLIKHFKIKVNDRHRAMADTLATVELFEKILAKESGKEEMNAMVNLGIRESLLPKNISLEKLHALPERCGVYYFHDADGQMVYVGKSINIKKRVAEHFSKITPKAQKLQNFVHEISYELTGSELVALLLESNEIKSLRPYVNRAQRRSYFPYVIHQYFNEDGYLCFDVAKPTARMRKKMQIVAEYTKGTQAKSALMRTLSNFELCERYCNLDKGNGACFNFHLKKCMGACLAKESAEDYNERAAMAAERLSTVFEDSFFLLDKGRTPTERAVILVENGSYCGYGYIDTEETNGNATDLRNAIKNCPGNAETNRIIRRFLSDNPRAKRMML